MAEGQNETPIPPGSVSGGGVNQSLSKWMWGNLQGTLSPQQWDQFNLLNRQFQNAFGGDFGNFDYYQYLTNPEYARRIDYQASVSGKGPQGMINQQQRSQALNNMLNFFQQIAGQPEKIDPSPIFDRVRGEIDALTGQRRKQVSGDVNRAFAGAETRVAESLAGTGLGRSGAAVSEFSNVATQRAMAEAGALERVESERLATEQHLAFQEMQFDLNQELIEQGYEQKMLDDALNFNRQLQLMSFEAALQYEPSSWLETFGTVIDIGANAFQLGYGIYTGNPAAIAGGAQGLGTPLGAGLFDGGVA